MSSAGCRRAVVAVVAVVVLSTAAFPAPAGAAASGTSGGSVSPSSVATGSEADLTLTLDLAGVNTTDGTSGATVTFAVPDAVDLSVASVTTATVSPNVSVTTNSVDASAGTVTVEFDDGAGVDGETLSVRADVADVVVRRTGTHDVTAAVDADADTTAELSAASVGSVTATAAGSDRSVGGASATMYLGEDAVDVTGLDGASPAGSAQTFYGTTGDAEGSTASASDTVAVDVTAANGFAAGGYTLSGPQGTTTLSVARPTVTDLAVYTGDGTDGIVVTNESVPAGTETVSVAADYSFEAAENLTVSVVDDEGLEVTPQVTDDPNLTTSGGYVALDAAALGVGTYTVTVEGADDLSTATASTTVTVRDPEKVVSLSKTRVVRGDSTVVSVAGAPGDARYVRIDESALRDGVTLDAETARALFDDTDRVQFVDVDTTAGYAYAVVSLDGDGISEVRLRTARLATGELDVELAAGVGDTPEDEVALRVDERPLSVGSAPGRLPLGETATVSGRAPQSETVKLYATVDDDYVPVYADAAAGTLAEADVATDGTWETSVEAADPLGLVGPYRLVAVADPGTAHVGSAAAVNATTLRTFEPRASVGLTVGEPSLSVAASRTAIAATGTDEVTLSGTAVGQGETLRLYRVDPRGAVTARTLDVDNGTVSEEVDGFERVGAHEFVVVGPGRDGEFAYADGSGPAVDGLVSGSETPAQALELLEDAYSGPGVDDSVVGVTVRAERPTLAVDQPSPSTAVSGGTLAVSGTSNREDGASVVVELRSDGDVRAVQTTRVDAGHWRTTLDLAAVDSGVYEVAAADGESRDATTVTVAATSAATRTATPPESSATPTATPTPTTQSTTAPATSTATSTASPAAGARTTTRAPGFGALVTLVALAFAGLSLVGVGVRRDQSR